MRSAMTFGDTRYYKFSDTDFIDAVDDAYEMMERLNSEYDGFDEWLEWFQR